MSSTPQTPSQTVLEHGYSVWSYVEKILHKDTHDMKLPSWFIEHYDELLANIHPLSVHKEYAIMHDCGKPYCLEVDDEGRRHFPNHAAVSEQTYRSLPDADESVARLIGLDMLLHTGTAEEIVQHNLSILDAYTLIITSFAEIHSNAAMFGGIDSTSFKIKWKKLDKRGKMLLQIFGVGDS